MAIENRYINCSSPYVSAYSQASGLAVANILDAIAVSGLNIEFVPVSPLDLPSSPYAGPPGEAVDQAWHDLLKNMNIRVTAEELAKSNQTSVSLPKGGGHMVWIGAHHQLHCIVRLIVTSMHSKYLIKES